MRSSPFIAALVSCAIVFSLGEAGSYLWLERYGNALDLTRNILVPDASIGWEQRTNLDTTFLGFPLRTNELGWRTQAMHSLPASKPKILVLGPSSTFGWGVPQEGTYADQLQRLLGNDAVVLNAGEIGYSTEQGVRLFLRPEVEALKPELVIIAYGVNDLDTNRFYFQSGRTDKEEFDQLGQNSALALSYRLSSDPLMRVMLKIAGAIRPASRTENLHPQLRVPRKEFADNVRTLISAARKEGSEVVLLTTAVHMPASIKDEKKSEEISRINGDVLRYNEALEEIALATQTPLGNIDEWFANTDRSQLFVDPIHFSSAGNGIIASHLRDILKRLGI